MKTLSLIALGTALGAALMFMTKPGPSLDLWTRYHGMGRVVCRQDGTVVNVQNILFEAAGRQISLTEVCR